MLTTRIALKTTSERDERGRAAPKQQGVELWTAVVVQADASDVWRSFVRRLNPWLSPRYETGNRRSPCQRSLNMPIDALAPLEGAGAGFGGSL